MPRHVRTMAALAVLPLAALAACSGGDSGSGSDAAPAGDTLSYWLWDTNQLGAYQACADAFTEESGVSVKIEQYGWDDYWSSLTNNFVAGNAPDVFTNHLSQYPQFAAQDQLLDLSEQVAADGVDLDQYQDGLADLWVDQEGARYGLPKDWDTIAIFYNSTMLADAGLTPEEMSVLEWNPTDGGTYEAAIASLTVDANGVHGDEPGFDKDDVEVYGLALAGAGGAFGQTEWSMYAMSNGFEYSDQNPWGTRFGYDSPEFQEALTWWRSLIEKGYMPSFEIATSGVSIMETYGAGKAAMVTEGSWNTNAYMTLEGVETAIAPTPVGPTGERASLFNGLADSVWAGTDNPDAAWQWVSFLGSADCQDIVAEQAVVFPAVQSSLDKAVEAFEAKGYDVAPFTVHVEEGTTHLAPIAENWAELNSLVTAAGERFLSFQRDADVYSEANAQVNALFE
ncbi:sugar ABC transporter substrate-binding protein [Actinotalea sp. K2]|uniref:ABC transporter substrate-binding protein n=1 Tax=Actinotalea sp. K2 TaxID=2939438 RepID=UPI0020176A0C|nr:sugar ABC transporter substrate-binding protein [Actinotalea sp. K2]MCL3859764.1 sugar ABC transporter substrate-binding protein [Actinotalea sp. K2]